MKTIEQIAEESIQRFSDKYENGPDFFAALVDQAIQSSIKQEVVAEASRLMQERYSPDINSMMQKAVSHWIESGQIDIGDPPKELKEAIERQINSASRREVASASNKKMQHIYKSHNSGETFKQIAERLFISESTARSIYIKATDRVQSMAKELESFGPPISGEWEIGRWVNYRKKFRGSAEAVK